MTPRQHQHHRVAIRTAVTSQHVASLGILLILIIIINEDVIEIYKEKICPASAGSAGPAATALLSVIVITYTCTRTCIKGHNTQTKAENLAIFHMVKRKVIIIVIHYTCTCKCSLDTVFIHMYTVHTKVTMYIYVYILIIGVCPN